MDKLKVFTTYDEQITLLKDRGLSIASDEKAKHYLQYFGYYNLINGYKDPFLKRRNPEMYSPKATLKDFVDLYLFDYRLRNTLLEALFIIEKSIKSNISYFFSQSFGVYESFYLQRSSFSVKTAKQQQRVDDLIADFKETIKKAINKGNKAINHYDKNHGYFPLWVVFSVATFGNVSIFYKNMKDRERVNVANVYNLTPTELDSILYFLTNIRNACAHGDRLYTIGFDSKKPITIPILGIHNQLNIVSDKNNNPIGVKDVLAALLCAYYLLSDNSFSYLIDNIRRLMNDNKSKIFYSTVVNRSGLQPVLLAKLLS